MINPAFLADLRHDARQASRLSERRLKTALCDIDESLQGRHDGDTQQTLLMLRKVFAQELRSRMGAGPEEWPDWDTEDSANTNAARDAAKKAEQVSKKTSTKAPTPKTSTPARQNTPAPSTPPPADPPPEPAEDPSALGTVAFAGGMSLLVILGIEGTRRAHAARKKQMGGM